MERKSHSVLPLVPAPAGDAETELVRGCRTGDPASFRRFVVGHQALVFAFLTRLTGSATVAEDLAQETFLRAYRAFPAFDPGRGAKVSTWLLTIARNAALDARKRRRIEEPLDDEVPAPSASPEDAKHQLELRAAIVRAVGLLPVDQREVFLLAELHACSMEEIAGVVGAPVNTVKQRLFRGRERLRALLAPWGIE